MDKNIDQTNDSTKTLDTTEASVDNKATNSQNDEKEQSRLEQELDATLDQADLLLDAEPSTIKNKNNQNPKDETSSPKDSSKDVNNKAMTKENSPKVVATEVITHEHLQIRSLQNKVNLLAFSLILAIGAAGFGAYYLDKHKYDDFSILKTQIENSHEKVLTAKEKIEDLYEQIKEKDARVSALLAANNELRNQNNVLKNNEEDLKKQSKIALETADKVNIRLNAYENRNPNDWLIAQSFFLISNAQNLLSFSDNFEAALLNLENADILLVKIDDPQINQIREAINKDILALKSIDHVDFKGMFYKLDSIYNNTDKMPLNEFLDERQKQNSYKKDEITTDQVKDWKSNVIHSLKEFSSRFIEIRRRNDAVVNQFLSPDQTNILTQNIKTEILLAKVALFNRDEATFSKNISEIINHLSAYYDVDNAIVKSNLDALKELKDVKISSNKANALASFTLFNAVAKDKFNLYKVQKQQLKEGQND